MIIYLQVGYNFYKNMVVVLPHFFYSFNNGFSATNLYDPWLYQLYNLFYTSVPIIIFAVIDEEYIILNYFQVLTQLSYDLTQNLLNKRSPLIIVVLPVDWEGGILISHNSILMLPIIRRRSTRLIRSDVIHGISGDGCILLCNHSVEFQGLGLLLHHELGNNNSILNYQLFMFIIIMSILSLFIMYFTLSVITVQLDISKSFLIIIS